MPLTASQVRPDVIRSAPRISTTVSARDRDLVLDCLRVRDLGGDYLAHDAFEAVVDWDAAREVLAWGGFAAWTDEGFVITPAGRRAWVDQRRALRDIEIALPEPAPLPSLTSAFSRRRATFETHEVEVAA